MKIAGLVVAIVITVLAFMILPIAQRIDYLLTVKKYGKEMADELFRY